MSTNDDDVVLCAGYVLLTLLARKASTVEEAEKAMSIIIMNRTLNARVDSFHPIGSHVAAALMRVSSDLYRAQAMLH